MVINVLKICLCILHEKNNVVLLVLDNNNLIKNNLIISIISIIFREQKSHCNSIEIISFF